MQIDSKLASGGTLGGITNKTIPDLYLPPGEQNQEARRASLSAAVGEAAMINYEKSEKPAIDTMVEV